MIRRATCVAFASFRILSISTTIHLQLAKISASILFNHDPLTLGIIIDVAQLFELRPQGHVLTNRVSVFCVVREELPQKRGICEIFRTSMVLQDDWHHI